jgi:hypothetical protein
MCATSVGPGKIVSMADITSPSWQDPHWLETAHVWIEAQLAGIGLARAGEIEQPHVYPWSTVLKIPTSSGAVWFKANSDSLRHEAGLVNLLASRRPDCIPPLLASDVETGWMLMSDAGEQLRSVIPRERSLDRWLEVLRLSAEVQLDLSDAVEELLALGVPDMRLATLPQNYEQLMDQIGAEQRFRDAAAWVDDLCSRLAAYGIPETIQHDDLHDGQVFVRDGRTLMLDWGDGCVSHPFFTLSVSLEGVIAWGLDDVENSADTRPFRDAYLAPYRQRYDGDLVAACDLALRLGWACRAVNGHIPGDNDKTITRLKMFVDGRV